jgi:hypothetical protein
LASKIVIDNVAGTITADGSPISGGGGAGGGGGEYIPATFFVEGAIPLFNGTSKSYVYKNCTVTAIAMSVQVVAAGSSINIRINKNGSQLTTATLNASSAYYKVSGLSLSLVEGDYLTIDVTQVGSSYPGYDLLVKVIAE